MLVGCQRAFQISFSKGLRRKKIVEADQTGNQRRRCDVERRIAADELIFAVRNQRLSLKREQLTNRAFFNGHVAAPHQWARILDQGIKWNAVFLRHERKRVGARSEERRVGKEGKAWW